jgi:uncharacterized protein YecT (DUF1311 family)
MEVQRLTLVSFFVLATFGASFSQSQSEMNMSAKLAYENADKNLNQVYNSVLRKYSGDAEFIKNLRASERLWIQFRDAELLVKYPENSEARNGSVFPLCYYLYLTEITEERTNTLTQWLNGIEDGEVCSGSIRVKKNND